MTEATAGAHAAAREGSHLGYIILISIVATIGGFLFGFDSGVINGTVEGLQKAFNSETIGTGFNVASILLGCAAGAFFAGRLADLFGRRTLLTVSALFFVIGALGSGIAHSSVEFIFFRLVCGLAIGAASVMAPAYISEIAPAHIRGRLATIQQVAIISGLTAAFLSNYFLAQSAGSAVNQLWLGFEAWRWMFWMAAIPAVIFLLALFAIPESPRYLVLKGKAAQAGKVLTSLFGGAAVEEKVREIHDSLAKDHQPRLSDLVAPGTANLRAIVWVGIGLATFQQLVGINVIFYYGAVLWQAAGFTESDALAQNVLSGSLSIAAVIVGLLVIDRLGRKPMLLIGSIGMSVTLALAAYAFSTGAIGEGGSLVLPGKMGLVALIAANAYVMFFNFSWGPVMWVMLGEMFPNQLRGSGLAISGLAQWLANFGITMTFPILLGSVGLAGAYGLYTAFSLVSILFVAKAVRETKGLELEEMKG